MMIHISKITIGHRLRSDFGDLNALAESIKNHGLIHPIVIDSNYNLVAGGRRLMAHQILKRNEIEVKMLTDLSEKELRILELEENIQRKDLTELEKSKNLVELVMVTKDTLREKNNKEYFAESAKKSRGQPQKPDGLKQISETTGIPIKTIHDAQQHVAAVEKYPELEALPKHKAIAASRELDQLPAGETETRNNIVSLYREKTRKIINNPDDVDPEEYLSFCKKTTDQYRKAIYGILTVPTTDDDLNAWLQMLDGETVTPDFMVSKINEAIHRLDNMRSFLIKNRKKVQ